MGVTTMRITYLAAIGFAAALMISSGVSAATLSMPAAPATPAFHTVAGLAVFSDFLLEVFEDTLEF